MGRGLGVRPSRRAKAAAALLVCGLLAASLTACMTGDRVHGAFTREFSRDPAVVSMDLSSADNMPFTGGVGGEVVLRDDISDAELRDFTERVRAFAADQPGPDTAGGDGAGSTAGTSSRVRVTVLYDSWRIPVLADESQGAALLDVFGELSRDPRVRGGGFTSRDFTTAVDSARIEVTDGPAVFDLLAGQQQVFAALAKAPRLTVATDASPESNSEPVERIVVEGTPGAWLDAAAATYASLRAAIPLAAFEADASAVSVTLAQESDLGKAREISRALLPGGDSAVAFQSDVVTLFPGAHGDAARALLAELPARDRARVATVWTDDRALQLGVADEPAVAEEPGSAGAPGSAQRQGSADKQGSAALAELARAVAGTSAAEAFETLELRSGDPREPALAVRSAPRNLEVLAATAVGLGDRDEVARVQLSPGTSLEIAVSARPAADDLTSYAAALKPVAVPGDRVCIDAGTTGSFCVIAAAKLTAAELNERATREGAAFIEAWNAQR